VGFLTGMSLLAPAAETSNRGTLLAVVAGGAITFLTATVGQLLGERFRRNAEVGQSARARQQSKRDKERALLDELLEATQGLAAALDRDRARDLERAGDEQAKDTREQDNRFRALVPQVDEDDVRETAWGWRTIAREYATSRPGEPGGPRLSDVDQAQDALNKAVGKAKRALNRAG